MLYNKRYSRYCLLTRFTTTGGVGVSTPCGPVATQGITVFVPELSTVVVQIKLILRTKFGRSRSSDRKKMRRRLLHLDVFRKNRLPDTRYRSGVVRIVKVVSTSLLGYW